MWTYRLPTPKAIDHVQLVVELGHPCSVDYDPATGLAVCVRVQADYGPPGGPSIPVSTTLAALREVVDAHVPTVKEG